MEANSEAMEKYSVVINQEEQYSIWPSDLDIPPGWQEIGVSGSKDECLDHIEKVWVDMRPLSLRKFYEELANQNLDAHETTEEENSVPLLKDLLLANEQAFQIVAADIDQLKKQWQEKYVYINLYQTVGETEVCVILAAPPSVEHSEEKLMLCGSVDIDDDEYTVNLNIDLKKLSGIAKFTIKK